MRKRRSLLLFGLLLILAFSWYTYTLQTRPQIRYLSGVTMGVVQYNVKYVGDEVPKLQEKIDELLHSFNQSLSTYIPSSEISRLNSEFEFEFDSRFFLPVLKLSADVFRETEGAFDPTIGPLIKAWGFGADKKAQVLDSATVDSLLMLSGFEKVIFDDKQIKIPEGFYLDFSAIAKGYAVDLVAELLEEYDLVNYLVEIGGEVRCNGLNQKGEIWKLGIEDPTVDILDQRLLAITELKDGSLATSGNYRNFYERDGKVYAHIIDPKTGYSTNHNLLSASVFAATCMEADAYATALMVMGLEKAKKIAETNVDLDVLLIYRNEFGDLVSYVSPKVERTLKMNKTTSNP
ncbi:MAG: FAD:protein FMN transferase [Bacteroidota bacterium]